MITKFLLNAILYRVGMSWINISHEEIKYEIDDNNHQYWLDKDPLYNTSICLKFRGSMFENYITHASTNIYILMCSLLVYGLNCLTRIMTLDA